MTDFQKMDRTWLCSVLFMDIVNYASQSVDTQMKWKARFNGYLAEAIRDVPESERVILDTGDGAAVCFLGAPEAAMFAALHLWQCFVTDQREHQEGLRVRTGINLGPVRLVKDLNGSLNAIGDGINAGQRIMSFAPDNQILVSQSFFQVVSCLSDDYKALFKLKGVETDKHVREHTVYNLMPPGSGKWHEEAAVAGQRAASPPTPVSPQTAAAPAPPVAGAPVGRLKRRSAVPLLVGGTLVVLVVAVLAWRFAGSWGTKTPSLANVPAVDARPSQDVAAAPAKSPESEPVPESASTSPSSATTPGGASLFAQPSRIEQVGEWSRGKGSGYVFLNPDVRHFTITFANPGKGLFGRLKKVEWVAHYAGDYDKVAYELDASKLTRRTTLGGAEGKPVHAAHQMAGEKKFTVAVSVEPGQIVVSAGGQVLDSYKSDGQDLTAGAIGIKTGALFTIAQ